MDEDVNGWYTHGMTRLKQFLVDSGHLNINTKPKPRLISGCSDVHLGCDDCVLCHLLLSEFTRNGLQSTKETGYITGR